MTLLLEALEQIRSQQGYVAEEDILRLSKEMRVSKAELYGVISFYSRFHLKQPGKYIIRICQSVVCHMNESDRIREAIEERLGIKPGEKTEDGLFSLELMECLGQCNVSPAMTINDTVYGNLTPVAAVSIIEEYVRTQEV